MPARNLDLIFVAVRARRVSIEHP